jgi:hypothetical protein
VYYITATGKAGAEKGRRGREVHTHGTNIMKNTNQKRRRIQPGKNCGSSQ